MLKIPIITWEEMVLTPKLADKNEAALKDIFRNYLLFVAAIEHPDNWSESFNVLCEKFDALSFSRCISISLSYSKDDSIAQNSKKFYHDEDSSIFYYVNQWHDRSVFTDMVDEPLLKVTWIGIFSFKFLSQRRLLRNLMHSPMNIV